MASLASGAKGAGSKAGDSTKEPKTGSVSRAPSSSTSKPATTTTTKSTSSPVSSGSKAASKSKVGQSLVSGGGGSTRSSTVAYTPTRTPASSLTSSPGSGSSSNRSGNLRGDAKETLKRTGVTVSDTSRRRSTPNPTAAEVADIGARLAALNAMSQAERKRAEREAAGVEPSPGLVDWNGMLYDLNAPYRERVERAGGTPFEGPVDWEGIAAAIFGGQSAEERDAALAASRASPDPSRFTPLGPKNEGLTYGMLHDYMQLPIVDAESGFVMDPETGTYYRPDLMPSDETRLADNPVASQPFPSFAPLQGLIEGVQAEGERLSRGPQDLLVADVPLPRRDPRGYGGIADMAVPLPGQVEGGLPADEPIKIEVRGGNKTPVEEPKEKTVWDQVVEGSGKLLENTTLGGVVKHLFPDIWYGTGETIKGMDDGMSSLGDANPRTWFEYMPQNGSLIETVGSSAPPPAAVPPFPDLNHNGIDDRLEGYTPPTGTSTSNIYDRFGDVVFPDLPPYNPGRDDEWLYFRKRMANGGIVGYADGGMVNPLAQQDPRIEIIAAAEDALENAIAGEPEPDDEADLAAFIEAFGESALEQLKANVTEGLKMRPKRHGGRMVAGPGGPKDDAVPAVVDGTTPVALSSGEFVMPADAVAAAGDGDPMVGAAALEELSARLAAR